MPTRWERTRTMVRNPLASCCLIMAAILGGTSCQEPPPDSYRGRASAQQAESGNNDQTPSLPNPSEPTPKAPTQPATPGAPAPSPATSAPLSETQAIALVRGSCIYAGCHADATTLMLSSTILTQLRNNLMPPPTQTRYTLRADDRTALVNYFQSRAATP